MGDLTTARSSPSIREVRRALRIAHLAFANLCLDAATAETVPRGALIQRWDYVALNHEGIPRPSELLPLRQESDDLADAVVNFLDLKAGQDALSAIKLELQKEQPEQCIVEFWKDVNRDPPEGLSGYVDSATAGIAPEPGRNEMSEKSHMDEKGRPDGAMRRNERFGRDGQQPSLEEGQAVFWRYSGGIFSALMHFSLAGESLSCALGLALSSFGAPRSLTFHGAGGFSSPNLSATMRATGYLTSNSRDATYRRLIETTLFVLDAMSDMRVGDGKGWESSIRVRLLHAAVRRKIAQGVKAGRLPYSYEESGIPINQVQVLPCLGDVCADSGRLPGIC